MFSFIKKLFITEKSLPVKKGDVWYMIPDPDNPFYKKIVNVRVKETKDGWVRYGMGLNSNSTLFQNEMMRETQFKRLYTKKED